MEYSVIPSGKSSLEKYIEENDNYFRALGEDYKIILSSDVGYFTVKVFDSLKDFKDFVQKIF